MKRQLHNLITILLTVAILTAGVVLPNLIYPMLDPYMEQIAILESSSEGDTGVIFSGPPPLYPMNLYDAENARPLSYDEQQYLRYIGITGFLLDMMQGRGMPIEGFDVEYSDRLLASFEYMETASESDLPFYVINGCDIDGDGQEDLQCAVSLRGVLIYCLILDDQWAKVVLTNEADAGDINPNDPGENEVPDDGTGVADNTADTPGNADQGDEANQTGETGEEGILDGSDQQTTPPWLIERMPTDDHYAIWSVSFFIMQETEGSSQTYLARSFDRIDQYFRYTYRYSFQALLAAQTGVSPKPEDMELSSNMNLNPQTYTYAYDRYNYVLYVYDLEDNTRIIFYIAANSNDCMGFIIQEP
ncbi:MAG: hypothetical protein FWD45_03375 [Coriobacteriia bacterium]|nr:hypothetical protein [Coriobacteriia bacterium]